MFFTQEDYRKIEAWLQARAVKDTDFNDSTVLTGNEEVAIVQDGENRITTLKNIVSLAIPDFINVTTSTNKCFMSLEEAVNAVPAAKRKLGLAITYRTKKGNWVIMQFTGTSVNQWNTMEHWQNVVDLNLDEIHNVYPDEEDITEDIVDGKSYFKFRNRHHNIDAFTDKGMIILRRNTTGTTACSLDDEDHMINVLTQDMIAEQNTIYVVEYNFNLQGETIVVPKNSVLWFQGGSINNGTLTFNNTSVLGAYCYNDMGSSLLIVGSFIPGQIMWFTENKRKILKWYDGSTWKDLVDITDYEALNTQIASIIKKHNEDINSINSSINTINGNITNIQDIVNNLNNTIATIVEHYLSTHKFGVTKVIIQGNEYTPDGNTGEINIPLVTADKTKGKLTIKTASGDIVAEFDGSANKEAILPAASGGAGGGANEPLYLYDQDGNLLGTYTGEASKSVTIPGAAHITFKGAVSAEYDGKNPITVNIPGGKDSLTLDDLTRTRYFGVLYANTIGVDSSGYPSSITSGDLGDSSYQKSLSVGISTMSGNKVHVLSIKGASNNVGKINIKSVIAVPQKLKGETDIMTGSGSYGYVTTFIKPVVIDNMTGNPKVKLVAIYKNDNNQRSSSADGFTTSRELSKVEEYSVTIIGYMEYDHMI